MAKNFKVDQTLYNAKAKKLVRHLKLDEPIFVREQAGMLAQLFAKMTPPYKTFPSMKGKASYATGGGKGVGERAVRAGFFAAVKRMGKPENWKDKNMKAAIKRGDTAYITERLRYMKGSVKHNLTARIYTDAARNKQRNNRGRVNKGTLPFVGLQNEDVTKGLKRAQSHVGIAKASFALAAVRLGRGKAPAWISRHFARVNTPISMRRSPARATFTASAAGLDAPIRLRGKITNFRAKAMVLRLEQIVRANGKKAGFKVK